MIDHTSMFNSLGKTKNGQEVEHLLLRLGNDFEVSEAPDNDDYYIHFKGQGISLLFDESEKLDSIFLYVLPKDGFNPYGGWLGESIKPDFNIDQVKAIMGVPASSGGGTTGMFNMYIPVWCKYQYLNAVIHYQFTKDNQKIDMVTLACK